MRFEVGHYYATADDQVYYRVSGRTLTLLSNVVPQKEARNFGKHTSVWLCQDEAGQSYPLLDDGRVGEWWERTLAYLDPAAPRELVKEIEPEASVQARFAPYPLMEVRYLTEEERLALQRSPEPDQGQEPAWLVYSFLDLQFRVRGASKDLASEKTPDLAAITAALEAVCQKAGVELVLCDWSNREDEEGMFREDGEEDEEEE